MELEGLSVSTYKGLKGYWKKREYKRLDGSGRRYRQKDRFETMGGSGSGGDGSGSNRRRFWRIKIKPKFRFFHNMRCTPKKLLIKLRDAYVKMMIGFGNSRVFAGGYGNGGNGSLEYGFEKPQLKEYDEKMIIQIYKSILQRQL